MERTSTHRLMWCCTRKESLKCKARIVTFGKVLLIKHMDHNHAPMLKKDREYTKLSMILGKDGEKSYAKELRRSKKQDDEDDDQKNDMFGYEVILFE
ncbi:unnamed protein product [Acanthoscelides obtectus]|nr:unnamed protein product [Acanthoscelides obtectus]CAK1676602.1 hypothetical protein AOBTE_LOCUS30844 [Acanthoscelides obtectus]